MNFSEISEKMLPNAMLFAVLGAILFVVLF